MATQAHRGATPSRRETRRPAKASRWPQRRQRLALSLPWALLSGLLLLCVSGLIYLPGWLASWPIEEVKVKGVTNQLRQQQLSASLGQVLAGENFFSVSLSGLRQRAESLDWVAAVSVSRQWPDTLVLNISERVPLAVWNDSRLVSNQGVVFAAADKYNTSGLPHLFGSLKNVERVMNYYRSISQALGGLGLKVKTLKVDARLTAHLTLANGLLLVVDRDNFAFKLQRFAKLYRRVLEPKGRELERVDLRYANGVAVRYAG